MIPQCIKVAAFGVTIILLMGKASCEDTNVALNKTVTMSSCYKDSQSPGNHAVDGNDDGDWYHWSCASTKKDNQPWMLVNLEGSYTISSVKIVNRADCCSDRLKKVHIEFGPSEEELTEIDNREEAVEDFYLFELAEPLMGQYLKIWLDATEYLTLCEIEVYGFGYPVNGGWSDWGDWSTCSPTCGAGTKSRSRSCTNPAPANGGEECGDDNTETMSCDNAVCPVDGGWTEFSAWTPCSESCGVGISVRSRSCTDPLPSGGGNPCDGDNEEMMICNPQPCPPSEQGAGDQQSCEPHDPPRNCEDIRLIYGSIPGEYTIYLYSEVEIDVFCDFYNGVKRGYTFLSPSAIESLYTEDLSQLYTINDHVLGRLLFDNSEQHVIEVSQLSSFEKRYGLSVQINEYTNYTSPVNVNIKPYLFLGFQPDETAPIKEGNKTKNPYSGYKAGGYDIYFTNCNQQQNSFVAFFADGEGFSSPSNPKYMWFKDITTVSAWYLNNQLISSFRYLPEHYFMEYEMRFGSCGGYVTSFSGKQVGILGATIGLGYEYSNCREGEFQIDH